MADVVVVSICKNYSFGQTVEEYRKSIFVAENFLFHVFNNFNYTNNGCKRTNTGFKQLLDLDCPIGSVQSFEENSGQPSLKCSSKSAFDKVKEARIHLLVDFNTAWIISV